MNWACFPASHGPEVNLTQAAAGQVPDLVCRDFTADAPLKSSSRTIPISRPGEGWLSRTGASRRAAARLSDMRRAPPRTLPCELVRHHPDLVAAHSDLRDSRGPTTGEWGSGDDWPTRCSSRTRARNTRQRLSFSCTRIAHSVIRSAARSRSSEAE